MKTESNSCQEVRPRLGFFWKVGPLLPGAEAEVILDIPSLGSCQDLAGFEALG